MLGMKWGYEFFRSGSVEDEATEAPTAFQSRLHDLRPKVITKRAWQSVFKQ